MGKYVTAGTACVRKLDFIVGDELVTPDSVTYTVTDNADAVVNSLEDVAVDEFDTSVNISLDATTNTSGRTYDIRYLNVSFVYNDATYLVQDFYQLRDSINFPLTKDEVRFTMGVTSAEVPDDQIDIFSAYQDVQDASDVNLGSIISAGGTQFPSVINAVKYWAAFTAAGALELLVFNTETVDNTIYARFKSVDFEAIRQGLLDQYNQSLRTLNDISSTDQVYAIVGTGTDPVTNT